MKIYYIIVLICVILYCKESFQESKEFVIYFFQNNVSKNIIFKEMEKNSLASLTINDIIKYNKNTHEITLSNQAFNIIKNIEPGTIFIVYLKEKEIYNGVVWSSLYSSSYDGIVIKKPLDYETREIQLQLGYPNENYFTGKDPRNNAELFKILKNFKKLE